MAFRWHAVSGDGQQSDSHGVLAGAIEIVVWRAASATSSAATGWSRSCLKGDQGRENSTEWAILAYNTDTLAVRPR